MDINAILEKIDVDAILAKITEILAQIDFQAILQKIIDFIAGLVK